MTPVLGSDIPTSSRLCERSQFPSSRSKFVTKCSWRLCASFPRVPLSNSVLHRASGCVINELSCCVCPQAYAQFAGAPLKLRKISNPWRSPSGEPQRRRSVTHEEEMCPRCSSCLFLLPKDHFLLCGPIRKTLCPGPLTSSSTSGSR